MFCMGTNKRALYESIMRKVSRIVKGALNESEAPLNWEAYTEDGGAAPTGNVEIYKEYEPVDDNELDFVRNFIGAEPRVYVDNANEITALDITSGVNDYDVAAGLVDALNDMSGDELWFVGDPTEEYVYVD